MRNRRNHLGSFIGGVAGNFIKKKAKDALFKKLLGAGGNKLFGIAAGNAPAAFGTAAKVLPAATGAATAGTAAATAASAAPAAATAASAFNPAAMAAMFAMKAIQSKKAQAAQKKANSLNMLSRNGLLSEGASRALGGGARQDLGDVLGLGNTLADKINLDKLFGPTESLESLPSAENALGFQGHDAFGDIAGLLDDDLFEEFIAGT